MVSQKEPALNTTVKKHIESSIDRKLSEHVISKRELLGHLFKQHVSTAIIAAFSFLIALSWKDVIVNGTTALISEEIINSSPYIPELISAIVVTIIAMIGILIVTTWAKRPHVLVSEMRTEE